MLPGICSIAGRSVIAKWAVETYVLHPGSEDTRGPSQTVHLDHLNENGREQHFRTNHLHHGPAVSPENRTISNPWGPKRAAADVLYQPYSPRKKKNYDTWNPASIASIRSGGFPAAAETKAKGSP